MAWFAWLLVTIFGLGILGQLLQADKINLTPNGKIVVRILNSLSYLSLLLGVLYFWPK